MGTERSQPSPGVASRAALWARHAHALHVLARAAACLEAAGVAFAPVKGVVLASTLYDDVVDRPFGDVDLLVASRDWGRACAAVRADGWDIRYASDELGEVAALVDGFVVELHAHLGRAGLLDLTSDEVLARATLDAAPFGRPTRRVDDIDHFLLLVANVVKDHFHRANPHQGEDLDRLLARLAPRLDEAADRARAARFVTGARVVAAWRRERSSAAPWDAWLAALGGARRPAFERAWRAYREAPRGSHPIGLLLACATSDAPRLRARALRTIVRRGARSLLGLSRPGADSA